MPTHTQKLREALTYLRRELGPFSGMHLEVFLEIAEHEYNTTRPIMMSKLGVTHGSIDRTVSRISNRVQNKGNGHMVKGLGLIEIDYSAQYTYTPGYAGRTASRLHLTQKGWRVYNKVKEILEGE